MLAEEERLLDDKLELSVLYFNSKEFNKALNLYNGLVSRLTKIPLERIKSIRSQIYNVAENAIVGPTVHPKLGSVLDQRAATHEKLGNLQEALKDAEMLMKYDPLSCKGYLRQGKILMRLHKEVDAYRTYQRGRYIIERAIEKHKIKVPERLFANLKAQHNMVNAYLKDEEKKKVISEKRRNPRLLKNSKPSSAVRSENERSDSQFGKIVDLTRTSSLSEASSSSSTKMKRRKKQLDPIVSLPIDLLEQIFMNLSLTAILNCHLVSRDWYSTLTAMPALYSRGIYWRQNLTDVQFLNGMKLVKRSMHHSYSKSIRQMKLRSTASGTKLFKILHLILKDPGIRIESLEIINKDFSLELLISQLNNCNWNTKTLSTLQNLRVSLNSSLRLDTTLLNVLDRLKCLDIVVIDNKMSSVNNSLLPKNDKVKGLQEIRNLTYPTMESLNMINHPKLTSESLRPLGINGDTYDPYPKFLTMRFPNLVQLTIVSYDFSGSIAQFQEFLAYSPKLESLYLENNDNLSIHQFCELLELSHSDCKLKKLTLREKRLQTEISMNQFSINHMSQLNSLYHLDLYASSLSVKGLLKMLGICNMENKLSYLGIGNSNYLFFKNDKINTRTQRLGLSEILQLAPNLKVLCLNEMELDNSSMKFFNKDIIQAVESGRCSLTVLDLSFCAHIDGIGLMNLFDAYDRFAESKTAFKLDELIVHGIELNKSTLDHLQNRGFVTAIKNDPFKVKWKQYGATTLVLDI